MRNKPFPYYPIHPYETFEQLLTYTKEKYGDKVLFRTRHRKSERTVTYNQFYDDVKKLATHFSNIYGARNKIAVVGENSYEWILTYFASVCSNNIIVPIDKELASSDIAALLRECECHLLVYSKDYDDIADDAGETIPDFEAIAMPQLRGYIEAIESAEWIETDKNALAVLIYTSGTTGKSKGVMLSQKNICEDVRAACGSVKLYGRTIVILPLHHTFPISAHISGIYYGVDTLIPSSLKNIAELITEFKPTCLALVPMVVEKFDKVINKKIEASKKKKLINVLDKVCKVFDVFGIELRNKCFSTIRAGLGGELDIVVLGGAPGDQEMIDRFKSYGVDILNGFGISECSPFVSINRRTHFRAGSTGTALPGVNVMIDSPNEDGEGEICVQGDIVMLGYYNMPEETEKAMKGGWFHTGDLGKIDKDGFIYITGRIKNLIILSNGKNVSPEELETLIGYIPGVVECLVSEEDNKLVAEIYPDEEFSAAQSDIQTYFDEQIAELNNKLPVYKAITKITIRDTEFAKTTTKKIRRIYNQ